MQLIKYGFDQNSKVYERGYARPDWSMCAVVDSRGLGWQLKDRRGNRSPHMSEAEAIQALLDA